MTTKPPSPQGISALLRKAGFGRSTFSPGRMGLRRYSPGYLVTAGYPESMVEVCHRGGDEAECERMLAAYAEAVRAAGWCAAWSKRRTTRPVLIVTAPKITEGE